CRQAELRISELARNVNDRPNAPDGPLPAAFQTPPGFAVAAGESIIGTSLWRDAWRRLCRNKLAVFGMIFISVLTLASLVGPTIIAKTTGFEYDYIPQSQELTKSFAPFRGPGGSFSWKHPMGTDNAGRDILARVLSGGQISLMVGLVATLVS